MSESDEVNPRAGAAILRALEDQLASPETPEVHRELDRLVASGLKQTEAKRLMAQVLAFYIVRLMRSKKPFDYTAYLAELSRLPDIDYEQEL